MSKTRLATLGLAIGLGATAPAYADHAAATTAGPTGYLRDLISDLYGGNGITLDPGVVFHAAHFAASSQEQLSNLSNVIASNIGVFTFNSTVSGVSFDLEEGVPVRSRESLGPLIAERATTIGRGRLNLGLSYTNIRFKSLDGRNLHDLQITLEHEKTTGAAYEKDVIVLDLDLRLDKQIVAFTGTYGVTNALDVGFVVPLVKINGSVRSVARVVDNGGNGIHAFGGTVSPISTNSKSAIGLGDMIVRAKYNITQGSDNRLKAGVLVQGSLATGDEHDLLGTGSNAVYAGGILSADFGKVNPHLNAGYEYYIDQKDPAGLGTDRSAVRAIVGFDLKPRDNVAISTEFLGRWQADGNKFYDLAIGGKWAPLGDIPISFNAVFPVNRNKGLRPNFYYTIGVEGTF